MSSGAFVLSFTSATLRQVQIPASQNVMVQDLQEMEKQPVWIGAININI